MRLLEQLGIDDPGHAASVSIHEYISDGSVALLISPSPGHLEIGSGTCVRLGDHLLVATVAHNVEGLNRQEQIRIMPRGALKENTLPWIRAGSRMWVGRRKLDIAWIELAPEAASAPRLRFFGLDHLGHRIRTDAQLGCHVQGYPRATAELPDSSLAKVSVESDGLLTLSLPESSWSQQSQTDIDFVVEYPPHDGSLDHQPLPPPPGLSGGGMWLVPRFEEGRVWSPEQALLLAITRSRIEARKELYGTRIRLWLELVSDAFSDVRPLIQEALRAS